MSAFFINRPIFAWVIALILMLGGGLALLSLPIAQYPEVAPTTVTITANYPGADAATVENSVTKVIEQGMTGVDNLDYMTASSTATGQATLTLTFAIGTDPDIAQVQTQNKLSLVTPRLPQTVQLQGVSVTKSTGGYLLVAALVSQDGKLNNNDLGDYIDSTLKDPLSRVQGVGDITIFGSAYAMRVWLDPEKLYKYSLMPSDITSAIQAQNTQVSTGQLGGLPSVQGQQLNVTVTTRGRLQTPEQIRNIILKTATDGSLVRISDVARVELGADSYTTTGNYNGKPAAGMAVTLATGANALATADRIKKTVEQLSQTFPPGVEIVYVYDTTPFVKLSIEEVVKTLFEAIALVFIIMLLFLQNFRATLIPTLAVPVVLLGTFGVLALFGYSVNTLTMFAMVLAIGLLVDDAIVVVENVERLMKEEHLSPKDATLKSMGEITSALTGVGTVLTAVFVPMAFFGGSVGVIYRQFSVTIASAVILSVIVALFFTPALCATMLKPHKPGAGEKGFSGWFNRGFSRFEHGYRAGAQGMVKRMWISLPVFVLIAVVMVWGFTRLPSSFLPDEDQGVLVSLVQLPSGATQDRTEAALVQASDYYLKQEAEGVEGVLSVAGFSFAGQGQNLGIAFTLLKPFEERTAPEVSAQAISGRAFESFKQMRDARAFALLPPAIQGFGNSSGFEFYLQDVSAAGHERLLAARNEMLGKAAQSPLLTATRPNVQEDTPQYDVLIDREKAGALNINLSDITDTLSSAWGGTYVNDFLDRGRVKRVYVQGESGYRMQPENLGKWHVRNTNGDLVPFSEFTTGNWTYGSPQLQRFNGLSAFDIVGTPTPGVSSGTAMNEVDQIVASLPAGFSHEWTGLSYQERLAGGQELQLYALSGLIVFLCLAALYESWSIPAAVLMTVPIGIFGAVWGSLLFDQTNDVYFKVGLLTTIGLSAKNAILVIEFALEREAKGQGVIEATLDAARERIRPILMTSLAFILGVTPLAIASGAGSAARNSIGIGVVCGMIMATVVGVFFIPMLYIMVRRIFPGRKASQTSPAENPAT